MYNFIINPNARGGIGENLWKEIQQLLHKKNINYEYHLTTSEKNAEKIAFELSNNINSPLKIVILGGDGTLNEVINGLQNIHLVTLGVIPIGSGNDFVRSFGSKKTHIQYLESILSPKKIISYNIGIVENEQYKRKFIVSSGIGFDAVITHTVNDDNFRKILRNTLLMKLIYILSTIKSLINYKPLNYKVIEEDSINNFSNGYFCIVMNTPYEGKAVKFCPDAKGYDDYLDFCLISSKNKFKVIFLILRAFFGKHITNKDVYISKGKYFKVESSDITHCHTDGEQIGKSNWTEYKLLDIKIQVIVE